MYQGVKQGKKLRVYSSSFSVVVEELFQFLAKTSIQISVFKLMNGFQ